MIGALKRLILPSLLLSAMFVFQSCNSCSSSKDQDDTSKMTEFEQLLNKKDTADVKAVIDEYFKSLISGDYYHAAGMLYNIPEGNHLPEPQGYSSEQMQKFVAAMKSLPIESYEIEYMKFSDSYSNEVMCNATLKGSDPAAPMKTKIFFKPILFMGNWLLTLMNTETGDIQIVDGDNRDSLNKKYEVYEKEQKSESKKENNK